MIEEKRKRLRINIAFPVECSYGKTISFFTTSKDLSLDGIKILCGNPLDKGKKIKLNINLITDNITALAQVVWCNKLSSPDRYYAGLQFLDVPSESKNQLSHFLSQIYNA
ncbi:MAG: PilZ domain-containing protein [Candidatus Omnitrophica bacterium]|nr:PilZ domain-containing protein [Candidatus Omnitrophota bacterium]MCM8827462.1 PilZ domain-containing protein [Candidatus Omnitrophota bacterium]